MIFADFVVVFVAVIGVSAIALLYFGCGGNGAGGSCEFSGETIAAYIEGPLLALSGFLFVVSVFVVVISFLIILKGRLTLSSEAKIFLFAWLLGGTLAVLITGQAFHYFLRVS